VNLPRLDSRSGGSPSRRSGDGIGFTGASGYALGAMPAKGLLTAECRASYTAPPDAVPKQRRAGGTDFLKISVALDRDNPVVYWSLQGADHGRFRSLTSEYEKEKRGRRLSLRIRWKPGHQEDASCHTLFGSSHCSGGNARTNVSLCQDVVISFDQSLQRESLILAQSERWRQA
jgi:hypothetical protein